MSRLGTITRRTLLVATAAIAGGVAVGYYFYRKPPENPLEAGLGWVVKLDGDDFIGRDALRAIKEAGVTRKLVGIEMTGRGIARHGYPVVVDGVSVGVVTSGSPSITLGTNIGLAYVPVAQARVGTPLGVEIRGKIIDAVVVKTPFYKRPTP